MKAGALQLRERAVTAAQAGRAAEAAVLHLQAVEQAPNDAAILNSAAFFFSRHGDVAKAIVLFERAVAAAPSADEPLFNLALTLTSAGRAREAMALLATREASLDRVARYWTIRAGAERALGERRSALRSWERADALSSSPRTKHGIARLSLETGIDATDRYRDLIAARPDDREAQIGLAQALEAENHRDEARGVISEALSKHPTWVEGLELLAQWRWADGETDAFVDHYPAAVDGTADPALYVSWAKMLAGVDRFGEAADVAARARRDIGDRPELKLLEARHRGEVGDDESAEKIFDTLDLATPDRWILEAKHRLRRLDAAAAERLCARAIETFPDAVPAWALRGIAWRMLGDPRAEWLHGQAGLIARLEFDLTDRQLAEARDYLDALHDRSAVPVGQSIRSGTQTRGGLFDRHEDQARLIETAYRNAVDRYRVRLPERDDAHPLLRHRNSPWRIAGSWSIRMIDAGHHAQHIHPLGLISSAAYFAVPPDGAVDDSEAGWLELGRPPADLRLDLPPVAIIQPRVGTCVLFPSTLFHGTRRFAAGKRMSVAIDVNVDRSA